MPRRKSLTAGAFRKLRLPEQLRDIAARDELEAHEVEALNQAADQIVRLESFFEEALDRHPDLTSLL